MSEDPAAWSGASLQPSPDLPPPSRVLVPREGQQSVRISEEPPPNAPKPQRLTMLPSCSQRPGRTSWRTAPPGVTVSLLVVVSGRGGAVRISSCGYLVTALKHVTLQEVFFTSFSYIQLQGMKNEREVKA